MLMDQDRFQRFLRDLNFLPDFVQIFALARHVEACEARYGQESLSFNGFVEILCRLCFCHLNIYGNNLQQLAPSKHKMLWVLAMLEARLPPELGGRTDEAEGSDPFADPSPRGPDSLWHRRNESFDVSSCPQEDLVFFKTMGATKSDGKLGGFQRLLSYDVEDQAARGFRR